MFENFNFGKTGFKTCVLEKHLILYSFILFLIFNALRSFFKNRFIFSKNYVFPEFRLIKPVFRSIEIVLKNNGESLSISINRNWFSINQKSWVRFLKNHIWLVQNFFKLLFLSPIRTSTILNFLSFSTKFFARFSSPKAGMSIILFLFHLFLGLHALKGYFQS